MLSSAWNYFKNIDYKIHLIFGVLIRVAFVQYGVHHDKVSDVPYTDVDYKVFTDASRHVLNLTSPYERNTYRYTPLIAYLLIPNVLLHEVCGKILFCCVDLLVAVLIRAIVLYNFVEYDIYKTRIKNRLLRNEEKQVINKAPQQNVIKQNYKNQKSRKKMRHLEVKKVHLQAKYIGEVTADTGLILWLYNPLSIIISTRGNCDCLSGLLVLSTLYLLQCKKLYFYAGAVHALAIHLRLYPIMYSLAYFMHLSRFSFYSDYQKRPPKVVNEVQEKPEPKPEKPEKNFKPKKNKHAKVEKIETKPVEQPKPEEKDLQLKKDTKPKQRKTIFKFQYLLYAVPNFDQIRFIIGCSLSLIAITGLFYALYGYKFLYESYFYHFTRKDTRHNFSLYFYLQYLSADIKNIGIWQKVLIVLPQLILLVVLSVKYGLNKFSLNFSILTLSITMVSYNTVITSQYFVWIVVVLPLTVWQIKMSAKTGVLLAVIWFVAQLAWLLPAYFLEMQGKNTFVYIWIQGISFFCANMAILSRLIANYMPQSDTCKVD